MFAAPIPVGQTSGIVTIYESESKKASSAPVVTLQLQRRARFDVVHPQLEHRHADETADGQELQAESVGKTSLDEEEIRARMIPGGPLGEVVAKAIDGPLNRAKWASETLLRAENGYAAPLGGKKVALTSRQPPWMSLATPRSTTVQPLPVSTTATPAIAQPVGATPRPLGYWKMKPHADISDSPMTSFLSAGATSANVYSSPVVISDFSSPTTDSIDFDALFNADVNMKLFDDLDPIFAAQRSGPGPTFAESTASGAKTSAEYSQPADAGLPPVQASTQLPRDRAGKRPAAELSIGDQELLSDKNGLSASGKRARRDQDRAAQIASSSTLRRGPLLQTLPADSIESSMTAIEAKWEFERKKSKQRRLAKKYPVGHALHPLVIGEKLEVAKARKFMRSFQENTDKHNAQRRSARKKAQKEREAQTQA